MEQMPFLYIISRLYPSSNRFLDFLPYHLAVAAKRCHLTSLNPQIRGYHRGLFRERNILNLQNH
jgi:hypothetical protein